MDQPLEGRRTERPDPTRYMRKGEGSPGGLKKPAPLEQATGSPQGLIAAARGGPAGASPKGASSSPGSPCAAKPTLFRRMYDRGDLPVRVDQERPGRNGLRWTVGDLAAVDLHHYLPVFVEGLQETQARWARWAGLVWARGGEGRVQQPGSALVPNAQSTLPLHSTHSSQEPYRMLARRGVEELVAAAPPDRLLPVLPQLVMGLRGALKSADPQVGGRESRMQAELMALALLQL